MRNGYKDSDDHESDLEFDGINADDAMNEALDGEPRAAELRRMRALLIERRAHLLHDLKEAGADEQKKLRRALEKLNEQISVLGEEANITAFVEDAVRVGLEMRKLQN